MAAKQTKTTVHKIAVFIALESQISGEGWYFSGSKGGNEACRSKNLAWHLRLCRATFRFSFGLSQLCSLDFVDTAPDRLSCIFRDSEQCLETEDGD